jgi:hypothetical protein
VRAGPVASWARSAVEGLTASSCRVWWTSFLIVTILAGMWGLANPPFAGPDEPAHVIRAHALDHGQLTGDEPSSRTTKRPGDQDVLVVRAPSIYGTATVACFAFKRDISASCLAFDESSHTTDVGTSSARHPPAYYAVVGAVSWLHRPGSGTVYLMRFVGALIMGAFVATAITALRRSAAPALVAAGLLLAITPMVLFVSGVVNPSVPEVAASLAFWVAGLVLVSGSHERVDKRLVTVLGVAGCTLALSRQLGPLWLGLTTLTMLAMTSRRLLINLARSNWARLWGALIVASAVAQMAWDIYAKPLDVRLTTQRQKNFDTAEILRNTFGASFNRVRQMIGDFGWLDTPSPALTWILWITAAALLFFLAVMWARRRDLFILIGLLVATISVPALLESTRYEDVGNFFWQGRYTLPLAVGLPVLSAFVLASTERGRQLATSRLLVVTGIVVCVAHILAFAQNLRRYTVGYDGEIQFWKHPEWSPPVSSLLLTIGYTIVVIGFVWWVCSAARAAERPDSDARPPHEPTLVREPYAATVSPDR